MQDQQEAVRKAIAGTFAGAMSQAPPPPPLLTHAHPFVCSLCIPLCTPPLVGRIATRCDMTRDIQAKMPCTFAYPLGVLPLKPLHKPLCRVICNATGQDTRYEMPFQKKNFLVSTTWCSCPEGTSHNQLPHTNHFVELATRIFVLSPRGSSWSVFSQNPAVTFVQPTKMFTVRELLVSPERLSWATN